MQGYDLAGLRPTFQVGSDLIAAGLGVPSCSCQTALPYEVQVLHCMLYICWAIPETQWNMAAWVMHAPWIDCTPGSCSCLIEPPPGPPTYTQGSPLQRGPQDQVI